MCGSKVLMGSRPSECVMEEDEEVCAILSPKAIAIASFSVAMLSLFLQKRGFSMANCRILEGKFVRSKLLFSFVVVTDFPPMCRRSAACSF